MEILSASLRGKIEPVGPVDFVSAEWTREVPQFVLLRYEMYGKLQDYGVRMDLDKRILMEDLDEPTLNDRMRGRSAEIWAVIIQEIGQKLYG